ncbi:DUF3616 domain-containing protein [Fontisphaera persica]|uniref:DUF3616 domain-containing protein n=1 Tax=Fontisphaera persica TaxID=2974023 RepID=UPI0024BFF999|nr:DUF3616 domain-containing protein [Fontisphaera persica]WCJ57856.1 DUF3616 domain-containing protein [Fontisphaera persica]
MKPTSASSPPGGAATSRRLFPGLPLVLAAALSGQTAESVRSFYGLRDASAAVALDAQHFAVADDEDNLIRVYRREGGAPIFSLDLSRYLRVDPAVPEADLEGAARVGELIYWITSHGRNLAGEVAPSRQRFFATTGSIRNGEVDLRPVGIPYTRLLEDLMAHPPLQRFHLAAASRLPPKAPGALNIEALAATPEGHLWIGFRNPVPEGKALLVPLLNPGKVILGERAILGEPLQLALGGRGLRSMTRWRGQYLLIAGSHDGRGQSEMYRWSGRLDDALQRLSHASLVGLNPEALAEFFEPADDLLVVSDDGNYKPPRVLGRKPKGIYQKQFRAAIIPAAAVLPGPVSAAAKPD